MKDNISPEEKLLRLIRGQKKVPPVSVVEPLKPLLAQTADLKPNFKTPSFFTIRRFLPFLSVKRIILAVFVISCFYLAASFAYPWLGLKKNMFSKDAQKIISLPEFKAGQEVRSYEFYLEGIKNKKIFSTTPEELEAEKTHQTGSSEQIKDISLVGIIAGENPQAVIEDKKEQKIYYLTKGESIGVFQVKEIQEGKVILSYGGKNYELHI